MSRIAVFFHCLFYRDNELLLNACDIVDEQMTALRESGLLHDCSEFIVGINGGKESEDMANLLIPSKAKKIMHGLASKSENLTIVEIEKWLPSHRGWHVLYFHSKGATSVGSEQERRKQWRLCMMNNLVLKWHRCTRDLNHGFDSVGCHWISNFMKPLFDHQNQRDQAYWAGNFWWATSDFLLSLPSIHNRARIHWSGIGSIESRYEAEVWIGNGSRIPKVKDYHPENPTLPLACQAQAYLPVGSMV